MRPNARDEAGPHFRYVVHTYNHTTGVDHAGKPLKDAKKRARAQASALRPACETTLVVRRMKQRTPEAAAALKAGASEPDRFFGPHPCVSVAGRGGKDNGKGEGKSKGSGH